MQKRILRTWTVVLAFLPIIAFAQDATVEEVDMKPHKLTVKADEYFDSKEYSVAIEIYAKAYSKEKSREQKQRISYNMAEGYRFTGQCKRAASYYQRASKLGYGAQADYGYAEMLQCQGEYEDAIIAYEAYKKLVPSDARADRGIESCQKAAQWKTQLNLFYLEPFSREYNSKKSDYSIAFRPEPKMKKEWEWLDYEFYISSMKDDAIGRKEDGWTGQRFSDLFALANAERRIAETRSA